MRNYIKQIMVMAVLAWLPLLAIDAEGLQHPCALFTDADFQRVMKHVAAKKDNDPVYASWQSFKKNKYAQTSYNPNPVEVLVRGDVTGTSVEHENYMNAARDAAAALQLAMRWKISGEVAAANAAINILNQWATTMKSIKANDNNKYLAAGFQGYQFANAAELMRDYEGWSTTEQQTFKKWLQDIWLSMNKTFLKNHGGNCSLHYWSNWDLANMCSALAIGIYTDDNSLQAEIIEYFKNGIGSGCIKNMIPYAAVADPDGRSTLIAQNMESGRDQGHATLVCALAAEFCKMAWNIGEDLFGYNDNLLLRMMEYTAKYNSYKPETTDWWCDDSDMPFTTYIYCGGANQEQRCSCSNHSHGATHTIVSSNGRGNPRPNWDLVYNHYRKNDTLTEADYYYTKVFAEQLRYTNGQLTGDGGAGDSRYGNNSGAFDQVGWGTMMFLDDDDKTGESTQIERTILLPTKDANIHFAIYNITGQKADANYKGIVIVNGKKTIKY